MCSPPSKELKPRSRIWPMNCSVPTGPVASRELAPHSAEVLVATTWECNLRCAYCFVRERGISAAGYRMTSEMATRVIDALDEGLAHVESVCVHLYGGEPLVNLPAMKALVDRARKKRPGRFTFAITTNGVHSSPRGL